MFSPRNQSELNRDLAKVRPKYETQMLKFVVRRFSNAKAEEYARHGYCRRLSFLARTIESVFEILPVDRTDIPSREEVSDAAINAQAMIFNTFGSIDNLAWVLVHEKKLVGKNDKEIRPSQVGLGPKCELVRMQLSPEMQAYLTSRDSWFEYLENFRHALAHRIPLYIPPYSIPDSEADAYWRFEAVKEEALARGDVDRYRGLEEEQKKLFRFSPVYTHSFEEKSKTVILHAQMLADFFTVEEFGEKVLEELDR